MEKAYDKYELLETVEYWLDRAEQLADEVIMLRPDLQGDPRLVWGIAIALAAGTDAWQILSTLCEE